MQQIAYLANSRIPSRAANTVHVLNMSAALAAQGAAVTLVARGDAVAAETVFKDFGLDDWFRLRLQPLRRPAAFDRLAFVRYIRRAFGETRFDLAYGRSCYGLLMGVPSTVPFAYDLHAYPESWRRIRLESLLFRRPNFLFATAITQALADKYVSVYPDLRDRVVVAPCAAKLPPGAGQADDERPPGPLRFYYVGHLYRGRGIDLILELAGSEQDVEFHIVGGEEADIAFWAGQAPPNVVFHGYVKPAELTAHYRRADLCIAPHSGKIEVAGGGGDISPWMSPMKIFEYMAHGKAIVAADLPVIREVIASGADGILCPPGDLFSWQTAIRQLKESPEMRARLGMAALRKVERDYTWDQRAQGILRTASDLLPDSAFPPGVGAWHPS